MNRQPTWQPAAEAPEEWWHRLPSTKLIGDRAAWLERRASGKRVAHIGFADVGCERTNSGSRWLHARLAATADALVGLDVSREAVSDACRLGYEAYSVDCTDAAALEALDLEPFDVVVAGEVIEHVDAPGDLLRSLRVLVAKDGELVVTTPNAYRPIDLLFAAARRSVVHPDHVAVYTPVTLTQLLRRTGWTPKLLLTYNVDDTGEAPHGMKARALRAVSQCARYAAKAVPYWGDGMIIVAQRSDSTVR